MMTSYNSRLQMKTDTTANWEKAVNFVPLKGELIIYSDQNGSNIKVGDGTTLVNDLPFVFTEQDISNLVDKDTFNELVGDTAVSEQIAAAIEGAEATSHAANKGSAFASGLYKITTNAEGHVTAAEVVNKKDITDLGIASTDYIASLKGANNGLAELNESGKIPSSQLPSYVDDVLEFDTFDDFPSIGESSKIYIDLSDNKTYRWGGSEYVAIAASIALGTTSETAFRGDHGEIAYNHALAKGAAFASGIYKITTNAEGHVIAAVAITKDDITALGIPGEDTNTEYDVFNDDTAGLVPAAGDNATEHFLNADGNWVNPFSLTANAVTVDKNGYMLSSDKEKLDGIEIGANKTIVDSALDANSTNPVENKAVLAKFNELVGTTSVVEQINALKGAANGIVGLDENRKISSIHLPEALALGETETTAYQGDRGKIAYDHAQAKGNEYNSGLYKITTNAQGHVIDAIAVTKADLTAFGLEEKITGAATSILSDDLTGSKVLVSNTSGKVDVSSIGTTELGYLSGVTSNIQTQFDEIDEKIANVDIKGVVKSVNNVTPDDNGNVEVEVQDGVSPTITIEEIENGNQVSITDVNGTQSFDVMDGESGVYYGSTEPEPLDNGEYPLWVDPTGEADSLALLCYPVGSIYLSVVDIDPGTIFGGTWERIKDKFLLSAGDSYAAGSEGGEATHTLTVDEMPNHDHTVKMMPWNSNIVVAGSNSFYSTDNVRQVHTQATSLVGGGAAHNNMPPYLAVYMWKRTA